jgi:hypothetical protein
MPVPSVLRNRSRPFPARLVASPGGHFSQEPRGLLRTVREARLRPEFAGLYPGVEPGVWERATLLADLLLAQHFLRPSPGYMLSDRVLPEEHFEFRGGEVRGLFWNGQLSRATDPL